MACAVHSACVLVSESVFSRTFLCVLSSLLCLLACSFSCRCPDAESCSRLFHVFACLIMSKLSGTILIGVVFIACVRRCAHIRQLLEAEEARLLEEDAEFRKDLTTFSRFVRLENSDHYAGMHAQNKTKALTRYFAAVVLQVCAVCVFMCGCACE